MDKGGGLFLTCASSCSKVFHSIYDFLFFFYLLEMRSFSFLAFGGAKVEVDPEEVSEGVSSKSLKATLFKVPPRSLPLTELMMPGLRGNVEEARCCCWGVEELWEP